MNALPLDKLSFNQSITASRKYRIEKIDLTEDGKLVEDAVSTFRRIFEEYSNGGQMSKNDCKRLQRRMIGDSSIFA